ncbi:MAG TPA: substrate-binding domain-containing protein [Gaiellaceae bacterium]|nr:substrate-binding domain-containing protein [Gaiellaceae bacterium]
MRRLVHRSNRTGARWRVVALLFVFALAAMAAGCGGDDESASGTGTAAGTGGGACDKPIWVLLPDSATSPRWESDDRPYFDKAFTAAGIDHTIVNAEGDAATQQSQAEQAIAAGAAVIVLTSNDTGSGGTIIDLAKEADVQVIEYDRFNTGSSGGAAYVSFDNVQVGATMAEVLEPAIDALGKDVAQVVELNGGEEDNNAFLFKDGYDATVQKHVADGSWKLVADQFVPGWGANGEGQGIMEQILTDANNKVDAVFAANDNLAQQAINALEAAGVGPIPLSGQDASAAGIQNILLGNQTMTVYKPLQAEAETAVQAALALCSGQDPSAVEPDFAGSLSEGTVGLLDLQTLGIKAADGKPADSPTGEGVVPYLALTPIGVTVDNIADTVIADNFRTIEEICTGDTADTDFCKENS